MQHQQLLGPLLHLQPLLVVLLQQRQQQKDSSHALLLLDWQQQGLLLLLAVVCSCQAWRVARSQQHLEGWQPVLQGAALYCWLPLAAASLLLALLLLQGDSGQLVWVQQQQ